MDAGRAPRVAEDVVRKLGAAIRGAQLYAPGHPLVQRSLDALAEALATALLDQVTLAIGVIGDDLVVGDRPLPKAAESHGELLRRLHTIGVERVTFERGVTPDELRTLVLTLAHPERPVGEAAVGIAPADAAATLKGLPHVRVGRIDTGDDKPSHDIATLRRMYADAVSVSSRLWEAAQVEGLPDPGMARQLIEDLAQSVAQNRTALMALTAVKDYDNYTFTHMVNVSILTMAQARALGIDGALLREIGTAALMHDIGKVKTPIEILQKPDALTENELIIMRQHVVDGAAILRRTQDMPALASVVAFEHHLRLDGEGYPIGVTRETLNLGTMLCSIADVYDAMRSKRSYQNSFPTDRVLAVLGRNDGTQFDRHLVRRFAQLLGIYPPGNLVRLDSGETAVVLKTHAPDPRRPRVRVVLGADGARLTPYDIDLWVAGPGGASRSVAAPVDPRSTDLDPLSYM
ncbi:MAG: HD-GYP domain-containing protein [Acidobacteriota bacterium]